MSNPNSLRASTASQSHVGQVRAANQDVCGEFADGLGRRLLVVADGMGGHAAGEVASDLAINALSASMKERNSTGEGWTPEQAADLIRAALKDANRKICESVVSRAEWRGMGTTMVTAVLVDETAVIGNVGDSRAYLLRDGKLRQLTSDHSWVNEQVKLGLLTDEQAHRHPMRNIVTRAMGNRLELEVEVSEQQARPGDVFLLCSDGLNSMLDDGEINKLLMQHRDDPVAACKALIDGANDAGGDDNITVIVAAIASPAD